jgi:RHS repeat-associated protein
MNLRCHFKDITKGYTKHYYAGTERVASKLGGGGLFRIKYAISFQTPSPSHLIDETIQRKWEQQRRPYHHIWEKCINSLVPEMLPAVELSNLYDYGSIQTPETAHYFYHPDHLGSASWITDSSGKAIQHLQYLPFGETRVDQRATGSNWSTRYSFSAKEKDEESGYGYFGARYYDSDISIWLSVDPMANKYPSLSPYNYCANNPIKLVDPNGEDVWEFDESGNMTKHDGEQKGYDQIIINKSDGTRVEGKQVECGTITRRTPTGYGGNTELFEIKGDDFATETFENFANHTSVEWSHLKIGTEESGRNIVGTSHSPEHTAIGSYVRDNNYTLREVNHNHPSNNPLPSGQRIFDETGKRTKDIQNAQLYMSKNSSVKLNIYTSRYGYSPYNNEGTLDPRISKVDGKYRITP